MPGTPSTADTQPPPSSIPLPSSTSMAATPSPGTDSTGASSSSSLSTAPSTTSTTSTTSTSTSTSTSESSFPIGATTHHRVLLIIDVQQNMLAPPPNGVPSASTVHPSIASVLSSARTASHPPLIIHIRNNGEPGEPDEPHTTGWDLVFPVLPGELIVDKRKNNAFADTQLGALVAEHAEVVVVGMQSDFCVRATCKAAVARGNHVYLVSNAHATYDRPDAYQGGGPSVTVPASTIERNVEVELEDLGVFMLKVDEVPHLFQEP